MDSLWVTMAVLVMVVLSLAFGRKIWSKMSSNLDKANCDTPSLSLTVATNGIEQAQERGITAPIVLLPATSVFDERSLSEITDRNVVARISQAIPGAAQTAANTAAKSVVTDALSNPNMFLVKIPAGTNLVKQTKEGVQYAYYGGVRRGSAHLEKVDLNKMTKATSAANSVANVMNVGSLVVGQYYMAEINAKLESMTQSIEKVGEFQNREFKSRILSVITLVGEISCFSSEIMENDEQRNLKLATLDNLKASATELLGQVNITIADAAQQTPDPDYEHYESRVREFQILVSYQDALVRVMEEISMLTYLLGMGEVSADRSYATFHKYLDLSMRTRDLLGQWHNRHVKSLRIDLDKELRRKTGFGALIAAVPGLLDERYKFTGLSHGLASEISSQASCTMRRPTPPKEVYDDDVQIVIKDGRYFYLHGSVASV